jgi:hypothetical protein
VAQQRRTHVDRIDVGVYRHYYKKRAIGFQGLLHILAKEKVKKMVNSAS